MNPSTPPRLHFGLNHFQPTNGLSDTRDSRHRLSEGNWEPAPEGKRPGSVPGLLLFRRLELTMDP